MILMSTNKSLEVKNFYDKLGFPGKYKSDRVVAYNGNNRYVKFISKFLHDKFNVLDAGCGTGFLTNYFAYQNKKTHFAGVDFSNSVIHADKVSKQLGIKNVYYEQDDLCSWKSKELFDVIICQGVLHHIPEYNKALDNLKKFLKVGGIFIIGLYHPWGKLLQKIMPKNYGNEILETDQEKHPFELSFNKKQVLKMFEHYNFIKCYPSPIFNYKNGGLVMYVFEKGNNND